MKKPRQAERQRTVAIKKKLTGIMNQLESLRRDCDEIISLPSISKAERRTWQAIINRIGSVMYAVQDCFVP